jgi:hypothetical protein
MIIFRNFSYSTELNDKYKIFHSLLSKIEDHCGIILKINHILFY